MASNSEQAGSRWGRKGQRPVRVANCSGAKMDPGYQMLRQATQGDVDFITGDYLAEMNLAENAEAFAEGKHPGWEPTAWDGLQQSLDAIAERHIKVVINGGSINPKGLAKQTEDLAMKKGLRLNIGYVQGDDLLPEMQSMLRDTGNLPPHLDPEDTIQLAKNARAYVDQENHPLVAANAYVGARAIVKGLEAGAHIVICGRVADASPVIGAAWYWHSWSDKDYNRLAGALVAGHLIECSGYVTGSNFAGFTDYPQDTFLDIAYGIAEIEDSGSCIITKHSNTKGLVNEDTVITQFLYELQGDIYLNSDVKAYTHGIEVDQVGPDRVRVSGITGAPPPPTTKLAIFYKGGFQCELSINATGYGTAEKFDLQERQIRYNMNRGGVTPLIDILEFQRVGRPQANPQSQLASTSSLRVFAQASTAQPLFGMLKAFAEFGMQHFSGMHGSLDQRTTIPKPFLAFYPAVYPQDKIDESVAVNILDPEGKLHERKVEAGHPPVYAHLEPRASYDTDRPLDLLNTGQTKQVRVGDLCLARSGDKGANISFGIYPRRTLPDQTLAWDWLRSWLSRSTMQSLLGEDWRDVYHIERVEFPKIRAVHFVIYGWLGRGVSSATTLDPLGKGFADYIRDKVIEAPAELLPGSLASAQRKL